METLGELAERMVLYWTAHEPQTALKWLKECRLGDRLIEIAMSNLSLVHSMGVNDMQRTCLWSDMMSAGELGVFPPETESADEETRNQVYELLRKQGPRLVDEALQRANLGYDWTPEYPTKYQH